MFSALVSMLVIIHVGCFMIPWAGVVCSCSEKRRSFCGLMWFSWLDVPLCAFILQRSVVMLLRCLVHSGKALTKANRCCWSIKFLQTNRLERYLSGYTMINFLVQVNWCCWRQQ